MEQMPQEAPAQAGGGDAVKIAQDVGQGLAKLAEMLNSDPGSSEEEKAEMAGILQGFTSLVEKKLAGGGEPQAVPAEQGVAPMEAGMTGQAMGPQTRQ